MLQIEATCFVGTTSGGAVGTDEGMDRSLVQCGFYKVCVLQGMVGWESSGLQTKYKNIRKAVLDQTRWT